MAQAPKQSTEVVTASIESLPAPRPRTNQVNAIVPSTWQEVTAIASAICRAGMAPKSYCKVDNYGKMVFVDGKPVAEPEKVAIAIMHGMEIGMTPMASLQSLAVINGMPSVYGDGLLALIRASGLLEDIEETMEWDKEGPLVATCKMWRKDEKTPSIQTYTRGDAQKARLWGKQGPWTDHQARMLQWRARGWCGRDKFADVLRGLHSAEEVEDMVDITPQASATTSGPAPAEPQRKDYKPAEQQTKTETKPQPDAPASQAVPAESGQPESSSGAGGISKPEAASAPASMKAGEVSPDLKGTAEVKEAVAAGRRQAVEAGIITDVVDQNEQKPVEEAKPAQEKAKDPPAEPMVSFLEYTRAGDWFIFADEWVDDPARTEAELVAFSAFYNDWIQERLSESWKSPAVREGVKDTMAKFQAAMVRAQKKTKAALQ